MDKYSHKNEKLAIEILAQTVLAELSEDCVQVIDFPFLHQL